MTLDKLAFHKATYEKNELHYKNICLCVQWLIYFYIREIHKC